MHSPWPPVQKAAFSQKLMQHLSSPLVKALPHFNFSTSLRETVQIPSPQGDPDRASLETKHLVQTLDLSLTFYLLEMMVRMAEDIECLGGGVFMHLFPTSLLHGSITFVFCSKVVSFPIWSDQDTAFQRQISSDMLPPTGSTLRHPGVKNLCSKTGSISLLNSEWFLFQSNLAENRKYPHISNKIFFDCLLRKVVLFLRRKQKIFCILFSVYCFPSFILPLALFVFPENLSGFQALPVILQNFDSR